MVSGQAVHPVTPPVASADIKQTFRSPLGVFAVLHLPSRGANCCSDMEHNVQHSSRDAQFSEYADGKNTTFSFVAVCMSQLAHIALAELPQLPDRNGQDCVNDKRVGGSSPTSRSSGEIESQSESPCSFPIRTFMRSCWTQSSPMPANSSKPNCGKDRLGRTKRSTQVVNIWRLVHKRYTAILVDAIILTVGGGVQLHCGNRAS